MRPYHAMALALLVGGCGADVATTAATSAALKAQEAKEAQKTLDQYQQKLDAAAQAERSRMEEAEKAASK